MALLGLLVRQRLSARTTVMRALSVSQVLLSVGYGSKRICVAFPDEDFEKKYPPDVCGDEASDHARVWKVYRDQAK